MRSPIVAMLWENWRLTRIEAAVRLSLGIAAGAAALALGNASATIAFWILIALHAFFWFSIARLNGGRFLDGYKPGFPLYLLYTRPVPTSVFVGVAMAYDAASCAALYVVSAALLGFAFGQPFPLFSVAAWIVAVHLACLAIQWSTRNRVAQWVGSMAIGWPYFFLLKNRVTSSLQVEFSAAEYVVMVLIGLVSFGLTVAGVARQRRGDAEATVPRTARTGGHPDWLVNLFRLPCPTSSATRAQVWFELKSSGLPVLAMGMALALTIPLLFLIGITVELVRPFAVFAVAFSVPTLLFVAGNAFGIRRRQGRTYISAFDATQPYGTAQQAGLKMLVRTGCVLVALMAIGVSAWTSSALVNAWVPWLMEGKEATVGVLQLRREIGEGVFGVQAVITPISIALMVAAFAAFTALQARYPRRLLVVGSLLLFHALALALLAVAAINGIVSTFLVDAIFRATGWIAAAALVLSTIYLLWSGFAERALTIRYVCGAAAIAAAFAVACLPANSLASVLATMLLPLTIFVLAPWSLHRIRHT